MSAVVGNIFEKWLQDSVSFGNPCTCNTIVYLLLNNSQEAQPTQHTACSVTLPIYKGVDNRGLRPPRFCQVKVMGDNKKRERNKILLEFC